MDLDRLNSAKAPRPGLVVALAYDDLCLFEFGIAAELFGLPRPELGVPWYRFAIAAADRRVRTRIGALRLADAGDLRLLDRARTIVIPGWKGPDVQPAPALAAALRRAHRRGARLLSICSGAFLLGHCGLLDGKRATTHWRYEEAFRSAFPAVDLVPDVLYVADGNVITSAGSAAGIDACLHLIRADFGAAVANRVAQRLVMPAHRDGGQRQFIPAPVPRRPHGKFEQVFEWARLHLRAGIGAGDLARRAAMSERHFHRRFLAATGMTPSAWLQTERIGRARQLLESTDAPLAAVAEATGFGSIETFRVAFRRALGVAPSHYRARFGDGAR